MTQCFARLSQMANIASSRTVGDRFAMWHLGTTVTIPTVGTEFKPYGQRLKESLL